MLGELFDALKARVRALNWPIVNAIGRLGEAMDGKDALPGQTRSTGVLAAFYMALFTAMACLDRSGYLGSSGGVVAVSVSGLGFAFFVIAYMGQPNSCAAAPCDGESTSAELRELMNKVKFQLGLAGPDEYLLPLLEAMVERDDERPALLEERELLRSNRVKLVAGRRRALEDLLIAHRELNVLRQAMREALDLFKYGEPNLLTPERIRRIVIEALLASTEFALERSHRAASRALKTGPGVPRRESSRPECCVPQLSNWYEQILALKPGDDCEFRYRDWQEWLPATVVENGGSSLWRVRLKGDGTELCSIHPDQVKSPGGVDWAGE